MDTNNWDYLELQKENNALQRENNKILQDYLKVSSITSTINKLFLSNMIFQIGVFGYLYYINKK